MKEIVKMIFGSHLYGTNTPESDQDFKGVFLPSIKDVYLGIIPKSIQDKTKKENGKKNSANDIDTEMYSLHYFINLACEGQTVALDMLHAPDDMILEKNYIWTDIIYHREKFYTKNLSAFVGYARKQASKYGIKGSRLSDATNVYNFLSSLEDSYAYSHKLIDIWGYLPKGEHIFTHPSVTNGGERMYEVCGRKLGERLCIAYAKEIVAKFINNYGERAALAADNKGIDWKAISHALRAAYQVKELLTEGTITFPLKEAKYLKEVKSGSLDYLNVVAPKLEELMSEVEELSLKSTFPEKVDRKFWDDFIIEHLWVSLTASHIDR